MSIHYPNILGTTVPPQPTSSERVAELVSRYPGITDDESKEILHFMRTGRHLEVGRLTANENIRPQLDTFMEDHKSHLGVKWWETTALVGGIAAALLAFWVIWEMFA